MTLGLENVNTQNNTMETFGHENKGQNGKCFLSFLVRREITLVQGTGKQRSKGTQCFWIPNKTKNKPLKSPQDYKDNQFTKFSLAIPRAYQKRLLSISRQTLSLSLSKSSDHCFLKSVSGMTNSKEQVLFEQRVSKKKKNQVTHLNRLPWFIYFQTSKCAD